MQGFLLHSDYIYFYVHIIYFRKIGYFIVMQACKKFFCCCICSRFFLAIKFNLKATIFSYFLYTFYWKFVADYLQFVLDCWNELDVKSCRASIIRQTLSFLTLNRKLFHEASMHVWKSLDGFVHVILLFDSKLLLMKNSTYYLDDFNTANPKLAACSFVCVITICSYFLSFSSISERYEFIMEQAAVLRSSLDLKL